MGILHYVARQVHRPHNPVLLGSPVGYDLSSNQNLLSRTNVYHAHAETDVQCTVSWNMADAFTLLEQSLELPSVENLTCILRNCLEKKKLVNARRFYTHILANGLDTTSIFADCLVPMFVKCGSASDAQQVFHRVALNNAHAWTYLIRLAVNHGEFQDAIELSEKFDADYVGLDKYLYQALLKACGSIKCVKKGQAIHCEIIKKGFDWDPFVGSTLLDMYAKSGLLGEAQVVFDELLVKDVVSWTALISGYVENGFGEEALQSFSQMQSEGVFPNAVTFMCSLKACGMIGDIGKGRETYTELAKEGYDEDLYVGSALVSMYINCDSLEEAGDVFDELPCKDVVLWTTLIGGYAEHGYGKEALNCLEQMQMEGLFPNAVTSVCSLKACGSLGSSLKGRLLHMEIIKKGFDNDSFVNTALVDMYIKCGSFAEAQEVFDKLQVKSLVAWNTLIAGYAEYKRGYEALACFEKLQSEGLSPDAVTLVCTLKACVSSQLVDKGRFLHTEIAKDGFETDSFVGISLLDMYSKSRLLEEAQDVFDELPTRDVVSWNALITGYAEHGFSQEALFSLKNMYEEGVPIDAVTAVCSLKSCIALGAIDKGRWIHMQAVKQALVQEDTIISSALVDMYAKCNSLPEAQAVFDSLSNRNAVSYGTLLLGYACQGEGELVFSLFDEMLEYVHPDGISLLSVLTVCSHIGQVETGIMVFIVLSREYAIPAAVEHYNCMVDLLSRAGQLDKAVTMLNEMPFHPNLVTWSTFLGSCRKCGDIELAKHAFDCAASLNEKKGELFILMAGFYAENNMWQDMEQLEELIRNK